MLDHDADRYDALVDIDGRHRRVSTLTLGLDATPPRPGDWLLVHTGFATERLTPAEAAEILDARTAPVPHDPRTEQPEP